MHASYHANAKTFYSTHEGNRNRLEGLDEVESSRATACAVSSESFSVLAFLSAQEMLRAPHGAA